LAEINRQIQTYNITVKQWLSCSCKITGSPRKPKIRPADEVVSDRKERDDKANAQLVERVIEVTQPGVDTEARWVTKKVETQYLVISSIR